MTVTVDSIAEGIAVLETPHGTARVPVALLPKGAKEGSRLTLSLVLDPGATEAAKDEIRRLRQELGGPGGPDVTEL